MEDQGQEEMDVELTPDSGREGIELLSLMLRDANDTVAISLEMQESEGKTKLTSNAALLSLTIIKKYLEIVKGCELKEL